MKNQNMPPADAASNLRTPKAAAVAGIAFSLLTLVVFGLLRSSIPSDLREFGEWLPTSSNTVALALNMVPFAGIAFLWFIGVLRDHIRRREDRLLATVFFGSGLLFLAMFFVAAAAVGAILIAHNAAPDAFANSEVFHFARATTYSVVNIYMVKMAAVFMISTSTVAISTGFVSRWLALLGYLLSLLLLFGSYWFRWSFVVFPLWVLVISVRLLWEDIHHPGPN